MSFIETKIGGEAEGQNLVAQFKPKKRLSKNSNQLQMLSAHYPKKVDLKALLIKEAGPYKSLLDRPFQAEFFRQAINNRMNILNAPTGSGKSIPMSASLYARLEQDKSKIGIIATPQKNIAEGFAGIPMDLSPFGFKADVRFNPIVYNEKHSKRLIANLIDRLTSRHPSVNRALVCSHQTLAQAFGILKRRYSSHKLKKILKDVIIWIDEAHHVSSGYCEADQVPKNIRDSISEEELDACRGVNKLGRLLEFYCKHDLHINLVTATPYRSDASLCVPKKYRHKFLVYDHSLDDYLEYCSIEDIEYEFRFFKGNDYTKEITRIYQEDPNSKTIIFIPPVCSRYSKSINCKNKKERDIAKTKEVLSVAKAIDPKVTVRECSVDGLYVAGKNGSNLVADVVAEDTRHKVAGYIRNCARTKFEGKPVNTIIALGAFKEGSDYPPLSRAIVVGGRDSRVELAQITGRTLRSFKGKKKVVLQHLLPEITLSNYKNDADLLDALNNHVKSYVLSLMSVDYYTPKNIKLKTADLLAKRFGKSDGTTVSLERQNEFTKNLLSSVLRNAKDGMTVEQAWAKFNHEADKINYRNKELSNVFRELKRNAARALILPQIQKINIDDLNLKLVEKINPLGGLRWFILKGFKVGGFNEIRELVRSKNESFENKKRLLEMARKGERKPTHKTKEGRALGGYTGKTKSTYDPYFDREIRKIVPAWFEDPTAPKKNNLLKMARAAEEKPKYKTTEGKALRRYTRKGGHSYDPIFDKEIRKIIPEWFVDPTDVMKNKIIKMAERCPDRPPHGTKLFKFFRDYTYKNGYSYDENFDSEIRRIAPKWFWSRAEITKNKLLRMAKSGEKRPKHRAGGGASLRWFTNKAGVGYDKIFDKEIRKLAPGWFVKHAEVMKDKLLRMAKNGEKRPASETKEGKNLCSYTNKTQCYDRGFDKEIRRLSPEWFEKSYKIMKDKLLKIAKRGKKRPSSKVAEGARLCYYTCKDSAGYDKNFDTEIRSLRPDWFEKSKDIMKAKLCRMARNGEERPVSISKEGRCLASYISKTNKCYDKDFDREIRKIIPDWFSRSSRIMKDRLLELARAGKERPHKKTKEGGRLRSYICKADPVYDPAFRRNIHKLRPDWFRK